MPSARPDSIYWSRSKTSTFSIKIAYWLLKQDSWNPNNEIWKLTWKYLGPQREDALHALRDCQVVKDVWLQVISSNLQNTFFSSSLIDWLSLNLEDHVGDGVVQTNIGLSAAGGVIQDNMGKWILRYNRFLEKCSVFTAELYGLLDSLTQLQKQ
ncbi:hypothetical protein Gorai_004713, partial [Gossypium raimondii]|nr:hypothetical protein [Gossypium raimondii]